MFLPVFLLGQDPGQSKLPKFEDVQPGKGRAAQPGDIVRIDVWAKTLEGRLVADTRKRGLSVSFELLRPEKPSWKAMVEGMKAGGVRRMQILSDEEWGPEGNPPVVSPGTVLIVTVKMIQAKPGEVTRGDGS